MTDVTRDMLIDYMRRKGGRVKNVDLVKHFRKYLLFEDAIKKERAREDFKEKVNTVAVIKQEQGEKFLYLKENSTSPPPVSPPPSAAERSTALSRITSLHENGDRYPPPTQTKPVNTTLTNGVRNHAPSPPSNKPSSPPVMSNAFSAISSVSSSNQAVAPTGRRPPPLSPATQAVDLSAGRRPPPLSPATQAVDLSAGRRPPPLSPSITQAVDPPTSRRPPPLSPPATSVKPQTDFSRRPAPVVPSSKPPSGLMSSRQKPPPLSSQSDAQPVVGRRPGPISPGVRSSGTQSSLFSPSSLTQVERRPAPAAPPSRTEPSRREPPRPPQRAQRASEITQTSIVQLDESPGLRRASPPPAPTMSTSLGNDSSSFLDQMTSELNSIGSLFSDNSFMMGSKPTTAPTTYSSSSSMSTFSSSKPSLISSPTHGSPVTKTPPQQPPPTSYSNASLLSPSSLSSSSSLSSATVPSPSHNPQSVQHLIKQYTPSSGNFPSSPSPRQDLPMASLSVRRESTPPDSHVHRSHSNAASGVRRRGNLDTLTRRSIQNPGMDRLELMAHRLSKTSDDLQASREALSGVGDSEQGRDSPMSSEDYYEQVDPVEKEWAHALIDGRLDTIHQLILSDVSYINKKGFLNGWTALHWAAKLGNQDMVNVLILSGALVDIKSNGGLTPLHLACEAGNEDVIKTLVREHNAPVNARDHSGKRPMDILNNSSSEVAKSLLRNGLRYYTPPTEIPLSSFAIVRKGTKPQGALSFNVPHNNLRRHDRQAAIKHVNEKRRGTLSFRKISFRRRKYTVADGKRDRTKSNPSGRYNQTRN